MKMITLASDGSPITHSIDPMLVTHVMIDRKSRTAVVHFAGAEPLVITEVIVATMQKLVDQIAEEKDQTYAGRRF